MRVLVIEDNCGQPGTLCESLQRKDYRVERVADGREAISRVTRQFYDLIILDLMLSTDSSLLVLHEIRELNRESKILILSTEEQIRDRVTALIQGADDYLVKPFTSEDLYARILSLQRRCARPKPAHRLAPDNHAKSGHLNHLIENLLHQCRSEKTGIELVISEVKLSGLLATVSAYSKQTALREVAIYPQIESLPSILVDARWFEQLLLSLVSFAVSLSPLGAQLSLDFRADGEFGKLVIEGSIALAADSGGCREMLSSLDDSSGGDNHELIGPMARARFYAQSLNLRLQGSVMENNRLQLRISNIRII